MGIHELVEAVLCKHQGITQQQVDEFDEQYDKTHAIDLNAGDDPQAPYAKAHSLATACERIVTAECGICWSDYDKEIEVL